MKKLMIVDDASFMRISIKKMLESHNYEVVAEASDGAEAIEKFIQFNPEVITMDITWLEVTADCSSSRSYSLIFRSTFQFRS